MSYNFLIVTEISEIEFSNRLYQIESNRSQETY